MSKRVKIVWSDILKYGPETKKLTPTTMITEGFIEVDDVEKIIISNPHTINRRTGKKYPEDNPTFYYIPKGLVKDIEEA